MLVYLEPNSFGLKSCSSFLSLTDLNKHICYSELDTKLLCVVPEFPRGSSSLPVFVSCQMDLRDPCKAKTPWFPCFCDFCTGLLYLCSSTSASQIYLLLFLKEIGWDIYVAIWKFKWWQWWKIFIVSILNSKHHLKQLLNCVYCNFQVNFIR